MGMFDYEKLSSVLYPVKYSTGEKDTFLEKMSKNSNWIQETSPWLDQSDPVVKLLNRTVLKATPLREEIYFIKCICYNKDNSFNTFTFVVNEHTIFKRFRIYKSKDETIDYFLKGEITLTEFLSHLLDSNNYRITFKTFNNETTTLPEAIDNAYLNTNKFKYYKTWDLVDNCVIKPINIQHFNKRTWIYLLTTHNEYYTLELDYKNSKSDAYYDKDFAVKYN